MKTRITVWIIIILSVFFFYSLVANLAHGAEIVIGYAPTSYHWDERDEPDGRPYNTENHAVMVSYNQWFGLTYENSHYNRTYSIGYEFRTAKWEPLNNPFFIRGTLPVGLMYGYEEKFPNVEGFSIGISPILEIGFDRLSLKTLIVPIDGGCISGMIAWRF